MVFLFHSVPFFFVRSDHLSFLASYLNRYTPYWVSSLTIISGLGRWVANEALVDLQLLSNPVRILFLFFEVSEMGCSLSLSLSSIFFHLCFVVFKHPWVFSNDCNSLVTQLTLHVVSNRDIDLRFKFSIPNYRNIKRKRKKK